MLNVDPKLEQLAVNTIRFLAVDAVEKANSGHPGLPSGAADYAYVLWTKYLRYNPSVPSWQNRDRFVLSAGHGSMLLYALLHLAGYDMPMEQLKNFRQWGSITPGHPERELARGVEVTTGPLGQGFGKRRGNGDRREDARGAVQQARLSDHRPQDLRHCERRRPDGGDLARGRVARRPPRAWTTSSTSMTTTTSASRATPSLHIPTMWRSGSRPTAGTSSA